MTVYDMGRKSYGIAEGIGGILQNAWQIDQANKLKAENEARQREEEKRKFKMQAVLNDLTPITDEEVAAMDPAKKEELINNRTLMKMPAELGGGWMGRYEKPSTKTEKSLDQIMLEKGYTKYGQEQLSQLKPEQIAELKKNDFVTSGGDMYVKHEKPTKGDTTTIINKIGEKGGEKLAEEMSKSLVEQRKDMVQAAGSLQRLNEASRMLDGKMFTGTLAEQQLAAAKIASKFGFNQFDDEIKNTEAFAASQGAEVGMIIKQFGSGTGLSDADREYAEKMAAGKITVNKESLKKIINMNLKARRNAIKVFNKNAKQAEDKYKESLPYQLTVDIPKMVVERRKLKNGKVIIKYDDGSFGYE